MRVDIFTAWIPGILLFWISHDATAPGPVQMDTVSTHTTSVGSRNVKKSKGKIILRDIFPSPVTKTTTSASGQVFSVNVEDMEGNDIKEVKLKIKIEESKKFHSIRLSQRGDFRWEATLELNAGSYLWKLEAKNNRKGKVASDDDGSDLFVLYVDDAPQTASDRTGQPPDPTTKPTRSPTEKPTIKFTKPPTMQPTDKPTKEPTKRPSPLPTKSQTREPTELPSHAPTDSPTASPTGKPTRLPTTSPMKIPTTPPKKPPNAPVQTRESGPIVRVQYGLQESCFEIDKSRFDICLDMAGMRENVTEPWMAAFGIAKLRWEQIITDHIRTWPNLRSILDAFDVNYGTQVPDIVDDLYIVGREDYIDGKGDILGSAGPVLIATSTNIPVTGAMRFDSADIAELQEEGLWIDVILHEMGHVLGIGTLWEVTESELDDKTTFYEYRGKRAREEWKAACSGNAPPIELEGGAGTAGGHWDESCFGNELMTGYLDTRKGAENPISRMTVAALEDIGYAVSYETVSKELEIDPNCCNSGRRQLRPKRKSPSRSKKSKLSPALHELAAETAAQELKRIRDTAPLHIPDGLTFVGGEIIAILVRDSDGEIKDELFHWSQVFHRV